MADILSQREINALLDVIDDDEVIDEASILLKDLREIKACGTYGNIHYEIDDILLGRIILEIRSITEDNHKKKVFFDRLNEIDACIVTSIEALIGVKYEIKNYETENSDWTYYRIEIDNPFTTTLYFKLDEVFQTRTAKAMLGLDEDDNLEHNNILDASKEIIRTIIGEYLYSVGLNSKHSYVVTSNSTAPAIKYDQYSFKAYHEEKYLGAIQILFKKLS